MADAPNITTANNRVLYILIKKNIENGLQIKYQILNIFNKKKVNIFYFSMFEIVKAHKFSYIELLDTSSDLNDRIA